MELNEDLVSIQGILMSVLKKTGDFTKISYTGGNEEKILAVVTEISRFLSNKNYMKNNAPNENFTTELRNVVLFLTINTSFKKSVNLEEYSHLTGIMPQFSKCLLASVIYGLDLMEYYCYSIKKLPLEISGELMEEMILLLRKAKPETSLQGSYLLLKTSVNKLSNLQYCSKDEDSVDNLNQVTHIILRDLTGICADEVKKMKKKWIYIHMGHALIKLFNLLVVCDKDVEILQTFIHNVLDTCCCIVQNITINVFCTWAEVDIMDENLQIMFANKAYLIIEKYQKFKSASQLISMLSTMAQKPKTLNEQIYEADTDKIISKINQKDSDQERWFHALITTQVLKNKNSMDCVSAWSHLCNESDVTRLLSLCQNEPKTDEYAKQLVLKCAANLTVECLIVAVTRHFYTNSFGRTFNENITPQIMMLFNKINSQNFDLELLKKELTLLLLQNPHATLEYMYTECLKNVFYCNVLKEVFRLIKEIAAIENIGLNVLIEVIAKNGPGRDNVKCYIEFFGMLLSTEHFGNDDLLLRVIFPLLEKYKNYENTEKLRDMLQILLDCQVELAIKMEHKGVIGFLLEAMLKYRCGFLNFCNLKQEVVSICVEIIVNKCVRIPNTSHTVESMPEGDRYVIFYTKFLNSEPQNSFFSILLTDFEENKLAESVALLLKVLPSSVSYEWNVIFEELKSKIGWEKSVEVFTFSLVLICDLVQARIANNSFKDSEINSLKFCLNNFGQIIQKMSTLEEENAVARAVCRVLRKLPDMLQDECFSLVNIIPVDCLKRLASDKDFVCLVALIKKPKICQMLAQKMLSQ